MPPVPRASWQRRSFVGKRSSVRGIPGSGGVDRWRSCVRWTIRPLRYAIGFVREVALRSKKSDEPTLFAGVSAACGLQGVAVFRYSAEPPSSSASWRQPAGS